MSKSLLPITGISLPLASISLLAGAIALPATAQQVAEERRGVLEEVVVTARRVEERLQDTPVSVSAFTSRDLQQIGVSEAGDIARFTPNLEMRKQTSSVDNFALSIRGVSDAETALAVDPTVGVYIDGVYLGRMTGMAFDIVDLERIEVLRGPQGTLFGRNTIGGAINIITEKPRGEFAFKQELSGGERGHRRYHTTIDTPEAAGFAAKASFLRVERDGELKSLHTGGELGQQESNAARLAVQWSGVPDWLVDYTFDWSRRKSNPQMEQLTHVRQSHVNAGGPFYERMQELASQRRQSRIPIAVDDDDISLSEIEAHTLTVEWDALPSLTLKSITGYREWDHEASPSSFGEIRSDGMTMFRFDEQGAMQPIPAGEFVSWFDADRDSGQRQFTQELQFIGGALDDRIRYTAGLYYFQEKAREFNPQRFVLPGPFVNPAIPPGIAIALGSPQFNYQTDNQSYAVYSDITFQTWLPELEVVLGMRYTRDEKETTLTNSMTDTPEDDPATATLRTVTDDNSWSNFNPSLTLNYNVTDDILTYAKVSTGYRSGGYNVRTGDEQSFRRPFDEEQLISTEIGVKSELLDRRLRFNAALFYMRYDDQQIASFAAGSGGASSVILNAGDSSTTRLEIDALWVPTANLRLMGFYGFLDVNFDEFITNRIDRSTGFPEDQLSDISSIANDNIYAPRHSAMLGVEYEFDPWEWGVLTLRADASYTDDISFHPQFIADASDSHTVANARATLSEIPAGPNGTLRVAAWVKNLTNEEYRDFGIDFGALGFATNTYGYLRHWGLDLVYEFNR